MGLAHLGEFRLHHQHDVRRDLGERAAQHAQPAGGLRQAVARDMPGDVGLREIQFAGQFARHVEPLIAQRGQCARSTAEGQAQRARPQLLQPVQRGQQRREPHRDLVAEGDRQRVLQMRAPRHHRVPVLRRHGCECGAGGAQVGLDQRQAVAHLEHQRGVHDVLGGGAPMRPAARFRACQRSRVAAPARPRDSRCCAWRRRAPAG